jgi:hypothetical protein
MVLVTSPRLMTSASHGFRRACVRGAGASRSPDIFLAKTEAHARMFGNDDIAKAERELTTHIHNPMRELGRELIFLFL